MKWEELFLSCLISKIYSCSQKIHLLKRLCNKVYVEPYFLPATLLPKRTLFHQNWDKKITAKSIRSCDTVFIDLRYRRLLITHRTGNWWFCAWTQPSFPQKTLIPNFSLWTKYKYPDALAQTLMLLKWQHQNEPAERLIFELCRRRRGPGVTPVFSNVRADLTRWFY